MEKVMEDENIKAEIATRKEGGRPPKKIKRCHIYMIRLTDLEQFTIAAKAKNAGTTISDFFRKSVQKAKVISRLSTDEEEIRLLTKKHFKGDNTEIHLAGEENKGGKVRVIYVPDYVRAELEPVLHEIKRNDNIFSLKEEPFNESYFSKQWNRGRKRRC